MVGRKAEAGGASPEVHADAAPHSHTADGGEVHIRPPLQESPTQTTMISLVKSTPKATTEQLCVVSTSSAKGTAPASAFGVQWRDAPPQQWLGKVLGLAVVSSPLNKGVSSSNVALRSGVTPKSGKARLIALERCCRVGYWVRGQQSHGGPQRPPASMTRPSSSPLDGAAGEA